MIWHTHAAGLRQMAASCSALATSSTKACTVHTSEVPGLSGHGGLHSAHAAGAGSPPARARRSRLSHLFWQSKGLLHVRRCSVWPWNLASSCSTRGKSRLISEMPTSVT